jgi:hypothetical protein
VKTSKWWILAASTLDSSLVARHRQLDVADVVGTSSWRAANAVGTSSWRAADAMENANVVGVVAATSTLASSGMSTHFSQFQATLVASFFTIFSDDLTRSPKHNATVGDEFAQKVLNTSGGRAEDNCPTE